MFGKSGGGLGTPAFGDAHLATGAEMETASLLNPKGIRLGYYRTPGDRRGWGQVIRYNGDGGLILVAPPRSGKARDVLVGALLEYDQSVIVVDPKGQLAAITKDQRERMGQRVVVLNPFNVWPEILGTTARYNPMALLDPSSPTFGAECRKLSEGLIAKSSNERDSHWTDGARTLVSSVIGHLAMDEDAEYRNLAQMREIIAGPEVTLAEFAKSALKSPHAFIRQGLAEYAVENAPNKAEIAGKISTAREQTFFLSIDTIADNIRGDDFRFGLLKKEPVTVYVILPDEHLDTCGKWFRLVVASALHDLWRGGRGACRVLAILDEFAHIGHLDILEKAAGMAAGHGLQLWPVLQNLTQLKKDYGENWETFIAGSEIRQFFSTRDQTSAKYVSETSGQRTVTTAGQSINNASLFHEHGGGSSDSAGQAGQPLIRPHEISGFGPNESLIFGPRNIVIDALRQPYFHTPELRGRYSPDPQHAADAALPPPVSPESITSFGDTLAAAEAEAKKRKVGAGHAFFGLLHGKLGWALLALVMFVPLAVWEIWIKQPWDTYEAALNTEYGRKALMKNQDGVGEIVESQNQAFWGTLRFFTHEALLLPGGSLHSITGGHPTLGEIRVDFAKSIDDQVLRAMHTDFIDMKHIGERSATTLPKSPALKSPPQRVEPKTVNVSQSSPLSYVALLGMFEDRKLKSGEHTTLTGGAVSGSRYFPYGTQVTPVLGSNNQLVKVMVDGQAMLLVSDGPHDDFLISETDYTTAITKAGARAAAGAQGDPLANYIQQHGGTNPFQKAAESDKASPAITLDHDAPFTPLLPSEPSQSEITAKHLTVTGLLDRLDGRTGPSPETLPQGTVIYPVLGPTGFIDKPAQRIALVRVGRTGPFGAVFFRDIYKQIPPGYVRQ